jgi:hypothetical protein
VSEPAEHRVRLIVTKVYRAFPELDKFTDAECDGFVSLVARRHPFARFFVSLSLAILAVFLIIIGLMLTGLVASEVGRSYPGLTFFRSAWFAILGITLSVLLPMVFVSNLRSGWLRGKIETHLATIECAACQYSLLGLPVIDGGITCPECGQRFDLAARGLTAADLLSKHDSKPNT